MSVKETLKQLESEKTKVLMAELYGAEKAEENRAMWLPLTLTRKISAQPLTT